MSLIGKTSGLELRSRVDFKVDELNRIIRQMGYWMVWEKSAKCPCLPEEGSGQPDFNCSLCRGKGRYWFDQQDVQGIMTSFSENLKWFQPGEIPRGTSYFTTNPENKIGFWDRLTHLQSTVRHSEIVVKGEGNGKDRLKFQPTEIIDCRTLDKEYEEGVDFDFDNMSYDIQWRTAGSTTLSSGYSSPLGLILNVASTTNFAVGYSIGVSNGGVEEIRKITAVGSGTLTIDSALSTTYPIGSIVRGTCLQPLSGVRYSINYIMHPRWIVIDLVNVIRDTLVKLKKPGITFVELPLRATVRLEWMVFSIIDP